MAAAGCSRACEVDPQSRSRPVLASVFRNRRHKRASPSAATHEAVETFRLWANRAGIPAGTSQGILRRAGVSRLTSSQPGEVEASSPVWWSAQALLGSSTFASRPGGAPGASGRPHPGLEHPSALRRVGHELQVERVRPESSVEQLEERVPSSLCSRSPEVRTKYYLFSIFVVSIGRRWSSLQHATYGSKGSVYQCSTCHGTATRRTGTRGFEKAARIPQSLQTTSSQELR